MGRHTIAIILAGGRGSRLDPLTRDRAKPAVPFGGPYRIIDFALSNCINSGLRRVLVLTQYKALSLSRHIDQGWRFLCRELDEFVDVIPPQQIYGENWYRGTADAVYQNLYTVERTRSEIALILAGDHIYKMNYGLMIQDHMDHKADLTIACVPVPVDEATDFGVMAIDANRRIQDFIEKPLSPPQIPGTPGMALASMGIYVFSSQLMFEVLMRDVAMRRDKTTRDFGRDIIPGMIRDGYHVLAHSFKDENRKHKAYWRDVGTIDAYYEASMDLITPDPLLNLYDRNWPIQTFSPPIPPPKFVLDMPGRRGFATNSIVCPGSIISGGEAHRSIIGTRSTIRSFAVVEDSILFDDVVIGRGAKVRRAILDKNVVVPEGFSIGLDHELDLSRGLTISTNGLTIVAKDEDLKRFV
ncbi:MAG: glucose-1-phosphate adenylyltransferase [Planctomycetota bacterium]|nr:glucose-1-phosphate adenylyltransferase [Planctomycetota bacterium]